MIYIKKIAYETSVNDITNVKFNLEFEAYEQKEITECLDYIKKILDEMTQKCKRQENENT